jgi:hypothetical protein
MSFIDRFEIRGVGDLLGRRTERDVALGAGFITNAAASCIDRHRSADRFPLVTNEHG